MKKDSDMKHNLVMAEMLNQQAERTINARKSTAKFGGLVTNCDIDNLQP